MTLDEFLAARTDVSSPVSWLDAPEFGDWVRLFASIDGARSVPLIDQSPALFEQTLRMAQLLVVGPAGIPQEFRLVTRPSPLQEPADMEEDEEETDEDAVSGPSLGWDRFLQLLPPNLQAGRVEPRPDLPLRPIPPPVGDADRDAVDEITAEHARLTGAMSSLLGMPSPPAQLLNGLIAKVDAQIIHYRGQRDMFGAQPDLAAFSVKLDHVLADLGQQVGRCRARLGAAVAVPPRRASPPTTGPGPTPTADAQAFAVLRSEVAAMRVQLAAIKGGPPASLPKTGSSQPSAAESPLVTGARRQKADFEAQQAEFQRQLEIIKKRTEDWAKITSPKRP